MSILVSTSIICKRLIAPTANLLTDFIRVPGGSLTAGFSILFLIVGKRLIGKNSTAMFMATLQGLLAMTMGIGSRMSLLMLVSYILPGVVIDAIYHKRQCMGKWMSEQTISQIACSLGVLAGTITNNLLFFRLPFIAMVLFYMIGLLSGILGGTLADVACVRVKKMYPYNTARGG